MEEVGIELLQRLVLDAQAAYLVLQIDKHTWLEVGAVVQRQQVVAQRQSHHGHRGILQQTNDSWRHADAVETKQETGVVGRNLKQRHLVVLSLAEGGACLGVNAQYGLRQQIIDGALSLTRCEDGDNAPWKLDHGKSRNQSFVKLGINCFLHSWFVCQLCKTLPPP